MSIIYETQEILVCVSLIYAVTFKFLVKGNKNASAKINLTRSHVDIGIMFHSHQPGTETEETDLI